MQPYPIIISPFDVYIAPTTEAFPEVDDAPAGNWGLLGENKGEMGEDGVTVSHPQSFFEHRGQSTGKVKVARTEEDLIISFVLHNLTAEKYAKLLNGVAVNDVAAASGTPGHRDVTLWQGHTVTTFRLLVRGAVSGYGPSWNTQFEVPVCYQSASPAPVFAKGGAAGLQVEFSALEDPNAASDAVKYGKLVMQDADALA